MQSSISYPASTDADSESTEQERPFSSRAQHNPPARTSGTIATALLLVLAGCAPTAPDPPAATTEPAAFERQCAQVASGQTDWIAIETQVITDRDLGQLRDLVNLRELLIEHSRITDSGLAALVDLQRLEHVRIREAAIGDAGIQHLVRLPKLRILNLPHARFSDQGLAALQGGLSLELLRFGCPAVTDLGMSHIGQMSELRFLHLIDIPITDNGLAALEPLQNLESLYLDGTGVTDAGIERFLLAAPEVHLHIDQQHHDRDPRKGQHAHPAE